MKELNDAELAELPWTGGLGRLVCGGLPLKNDPGLGDGRAVEVVGAEVCVPVARTLLGAAGSTAETPSVLSDSVIRLIVGCRRLKLAATEGLFEEAPTCAIATASPAEVSSDTE